MQYIYTTQYSYNNYHLGAVEQYIYTTQYSYNNYHLGTVENKLDFQGSGLNSEVQVISFFEISIFLRKLLINSVIGLIQWSKRARLSETDPKLIS